MNTIRHDLLTMLARSELQLPAPGEGQTPARHRKLYEFARRLPVSPARLIEAHADAAAIIHEAGRLPSAEVLYGVWASEAPNRDLVIDRQAATVTGTKSFCSGLGIVDRALVTATADDGLPWLMDLEVTPSATVIVEADSWSTEALADTFTGTATFDHHPYGTDAFVGAQGWYLDRPGFWHGACGPAACWAGAAAGLADHAELAVDTNPHRRAQLGGIRAATWDMAAMLEHAGRLIDLRPDDLNSGKFIALALRHRIERSCAELLDLFGRALGPRPFISDPAVSHRFSDVQLYLRQHHGERDLHLLADIEAISER